MNNWNKNIGDGTIPARTFLIHHFPQPDHQFSLQTFTNYFFQYNYILAWKTKSKYMTKIIHSYIINYKLQLQLYLILSFKYIYIYIYTYI